jgi:hypothetical protein
MKLDQTLTPHKKLKLLEENIGVSLFDFGLDDEFFT